MLDQIIKGTNPHATPTRLKDMGDGTFAEVVAIAGNFDSTGQPFDPDACAHTYAYTDGLLTTDTATDGAASWVKTYTYTSGVLSAESKWVKQ